MKVSLITVSYNSEATIADTIQSVISQDYKNIEYIIVDGGSSDNTMDIVHQHQEGISQQISEKDKGIYDAMNKGIDMATGDIIGILNSDDFYADNQVVSKMVKAFEDGTEGVYADLVYVDAVQTDKVVRTWISGDYHIGSFKKGWMPPHPTFFVKKEVYKKFGSYSLKLRSAADYEFMLRVIHKHGIKLNYLPQITVRMRAGGTSNVSLKNRLKANKEDRLAWKMNNIKPHVFTFIRKPLSKLGQFFKK